MIRCSYCDASFEDDASYLDHLATTHKAELGPIDQRRLKAQGADTSRRSRFRHFDLPGSRNRRLEAGIGILLIVTIGLFFWGADFGFSVGGVHEHGELYVTIDGESVDFDQAQYHEPDRFHFHRSDGVTWHMHPDRLTFEAAMADLGISVTDSSVTIEGTLYDDSAENTSVDLTINGEPALLDQPIHDGDRIDIVVVTQ